MGSGEGAAGQGDPKRVSSHGGRGVIFSIVEIMPDRSDPLLGPHLRVPRYSLILLAGGSANLVCPYLNPTAIPG